MVKTLIEFVRDRSGNFATLVAVAALPLLGSAALAIDYSRAANARYDLQELADASAIAVVKEASGKLSVATGDSEKSLKNYGIEYFESQNSLEDVRVSIDIDTTAETVTANASYPMKTSITRTLGMYDWPITVSAVAQSVGPSASYCMIALNENRNPAINFDGTSDFSAPNCYVHSNGTGSRSMLQKRRKHCLRRAFLRCRTGTGQLLTHSGRKLRSAA